MSTEVELLVFDVYGDHGCFRLPYTTTSVVTYPFPPRTAIAGLVGALLGLQKESYDHIFSEDSSKISVRIMSPIKKIHIGLNLIDTKDKLPLRNYIRTQIPFELVKDCNYRIFIWLKDKELFSRLEEYLKEHKCTYTPYLGVAFALANFSYIGKFKATEKKGEDVFIDSVVPKRYFNTVLIDNNSKYHIVKRMPLYMNNDRVVYKFEDFMFEVDAKKIHIKNSEYFEVVEKGDKIFLY